MSAIKVFEQGFAQVHELLHEGVAGLTPAELAERLDAEANPVGWLAWHIARVQDQVLSVLTGQQEVWSAEGWDARFALEGSASTGEGHSSDEVAQVPVSDVALILSYADAAAERVEQALTMLGDDGLEEEAPIAPGLTKRGLLMLVLAGVLQHAGQAAYVRGILLRARAA